jgi:hypothetical protein
LFARAALALPAPPRVALEVVPGRGAHRLERLDDRRFAVEGDDLLDSAWARLLRRGDARAGDVFRQPGLAVRVERADGGRVQRIVVTADRPLDTQSLLVWRDGALRRW